MNSKDIITDRVYYECDGGRVHIGYDEEDDIYELSNSYSNKSSRNIHTLFIPNSINGKAVTIYGDLLDGMPDIERFEVAEDNPHFCLYEGGLYSKDMTELIFMPPKYEGKTFFVPDGVIKIADSALYRGCLETIVIPEGCRRMIEYSCSAVKSLKRIYIPKSMEFIGFKAFVGTAPEEVFYEGSEEDRAKIDFCDEGFNAGLIDAVWHYNFVIPKSPDEI